MIPIDNRISDLFWCSRNMGAFCLERIFLDQRMVKQQKSWDHFSVVTISKDVSYSVYGVYWIKNVYSPSVLSIVT